MSSQATSHRPASGLRHYISSQTQKSWKETSSRHTAMQTRFKSRPSVCPSTPLAAWTPDINKWWDNCISPSPLACRACVSQALEIKDHPVKMWQAVHCSPGSHSCDKEPSNVCSLEVPVNFTECGPRGNGCFEPKYFFSFVLALSPPF